MPTLYLDLISGISGDMLLGALLDLGVRLPDVERSLAGLKVGGYHLHAGPDQRSGITGTRFEVHLESEHEHAPAPNPNPEHVQAHGHAHEHGHGHPHEPAARHHEHERTFAAIRQMIVASSLSPWVRERAVRVFERIAAAEGKIHGLSPAEVHFHEVGAVDSIVDIVGACVALERLGCPRVLASPVCEGTGWVECAHGRFPVPAPATLEILGARGIAVSQCDEPHELVTPTGAALLAEFVEEFGLMAGLRAQRIGYGIGARRMRTRPNVLRAVLGEVEPRAATTHDWETDTVAVLETNLDDLNAELLGPFIEAALQAGALEAFYTPVQMKKGRPGVLLSVLCHRADADRLSELVLRETSAFGVRQTTAERRKLRRELCPVTTPFGEVAVKLGWLDGQVVQAAPEFEDCRRLALAAGVPVKTVYAAAIAAWGMAASSGLVGQGADEPARRGLADTARGDARPTGKPK